MLPHPSKIAVYCIIFSEFCERLSFCGFRSILSMYLRNVLALHENAATVIYHVFIMVCYSMPLFGAILADNCIGRYNAILYFSILYLFGTILMCCSAFFSLMLPQMATSMIGLVLIGTGTGGIKPCVTAFGGDQFRLPAENCALQRFFSMFYSAVNLGGFIGMIFTPALRRSVAYLGDEISYGASFALAAMLMFISILIFECGKSYYRIKKPRNIVTVQFISCTWHAIRSRLSHDWSTGPPPSHWLDYSCKKYGCSLVGDMKVVYSILYLYLPVPIFWSLYDQQGSRWTFQASRLCNELFGLTFLPDQLQVLNPGLVLLLMPICPGGSWPVVPDLPPLTKMFIGGTLASLAFTSAGILQLAIERSTLQQPKASETGVVFLNTLACNVDVYLQGRGSVPVEAYGTSLVTPLKRSNISIAISCPTLCAGRQMNTIKLKEEFPTTGGMFTPVVIAQNSDDELTVSMMEPSAFSKSLNGKPKLKLVYVGDSGPDKNVTIDVETEQLSESFHVSNAPVDHIDASDCMLLKAGSFRWRARSASDDFTGFGTGHLRTGGVYVLILRERLGMLDAAVLHAPNPPNELQMAWILPQFALMAVADIMFAVSGLEFSFTQAPRSMKTITIAAWYVSVAIGNFIVIVVAQAKFFQCRATEFFVYAVVLFAAMLLFLRLSHGFQPRETCECDTSDESQPLFLKRNVLTVKQQPISLGHSNSSWDDLTTSSLTQDLS